MLVLHPASQLFSVFRQHEGPRAAKSSAATRQGQVWESLGPEKSSQVTSVPPNKSEDWRLVYWSISCLPFLLSPALTSWHFSASSALHTPCLPLPPWTPALQLFLTTCAASPCRFSLMVWITVRFLLSRSLPLSLLSVLLLTTMEGQAWDAHYMFLCNFHDTIPSMHLWSHPVVFSSHGFISSLTRPTLGLYCVYKVCRAQWLTACYVTANGLELQMLLPALPMCWDNGVSHWVPIFYS